MSLPQWVGEGIPPAGQAVGGVGNQLRQGRHRRRDGRHAQASRQAEPLQPGPTHKHKHRADGQNQQRAGQVRLQQHQHRDRAENQREGQHAGGEGFHPVMIQRYDVGKHQHHREFCDLAGLQGTQPRQHDPPLAAVVLRHKQHYREQNQRQTQHRPGQLVPNVVVHQAGRVHGRHAQRRKQQLRPDVGVGVAAAVQCHRISGRKQHDQPITEQCQQYNQERHIERGQRRRPGLEFLHQHSHTKRPLRRVYAGDGGFIPYLCRSRLSIV